MNYLYKSRHITKMISISIALLCWSLSLFHIINDNLSAKADSITAFSTNTPCSVDLPFNLTKLNETTWQLSSSQSSTDFDDIFSTLRQMDNNVTLIQKHCSCNYNDYYLYSPVIESMYNVAPTSYGFNLHIAISISTDKTYLGIPYINYDF